MDAAATISIEHYHDQLGNLLWVLPIPPDGDCLFGAVASQVYGVTPLHHLFKPYSHLLRQLAQSEIERNFDVYKPTITLHASEVFSSYPVSPEQKALLYLDSLRQPSFWGGSECLSALANRLGIRIYVHLFDSVIPFDPSYPVSDIPEYHILYRDDHYDGVVCVRPFEFRLAVPEHVPTRTVLLAHSQRDAVVCDFGEDNKSLMIAFGHQRIFT